MLVDIWGNFLERLGWESPDIICSNIFTRLRASWHKLCALDRWEELGREEWSLGRRWVPLICHDTGRKTVFWGIPEKPIHVGHGVPVPCFFFQSMVGGIQQPSALYCQLYGVGQTQGHSLQPAHRSHRLATAVVILPCFPSDLLSPASWHPISFCLLSRHLLLLGAAEFHAPQAWSQAMFKNKAAETSAGTGLHEIKWREILLLQKVGKRQLEMNRLPDSWQTRRLSAIDGNIGTATIMASKVKKAIKKL